MNADVLDTMLDILRDGEILDDIKLKELTLYLESNPKDPQHVAGEMLRRGWLSDYQTNLLLGGKGQELLLGQYIILDKLGEGGMGQVFKARHRLMNRVVALKVMSKEQVASAESVRRFHQEIRAAAALSHPNVIMAHDADQVGDVHFFVMEYVEGCDLAKYVYLHGPMPIGQACECIRQAAIGLQHAFERGMVHRDIKPSNLLLTREGVVKILDMGLARLGASTEGNTALTGTGMMMGTPDFIAPEQANNARGVDIRADLYSLGCTMFFLLTQQPPFVGGTGLEKVIKHVSDKPPDVESLRAGVPPEIAAAVRKLLAKQPADRFQTPAQLAAVLAPFCEKIVFTEILEPTLSPTTSRLVIPMPPHATPPASVEATNKEHTPPAPVGPQTFPDESSPGRLVAHDASFPPLEDLVRTDPLTGAKARKAPAPPPGPAAPAAMGTLATPPLAPQSVTGPMVPSPQDKPRSGAATRRWLPLVAGLAIAAAAVIISLAIWKGTQSGHDTSLASGTRDTRQAPAISERGPDTGPAVVKPPPHPDKYALLIGVGNYAKDELRELPNATGDMEELSQALQDVGYREDHIIVLDSKRGADKPRLMPQGANIRRELQALARDHLPGDSILMAWMGHGVQFPDGDAYLCPADARLGDRSTLLPLAEVYRALAQSPAGYKLFLVDASRVPQRPADAAPGLDLKSPPRLQKQPPDGVAVLFSCSPGERGFDRADVPQGVFFHSVCGALVGGADLARTVREQVSDYVKQTYKEKQVPMRLGQTGGTMLLASLQPFQKAPQPVVELPTPTTEKVGLIRRLEGHTKSIRGVAFSPDGLFALSCGQDNSVRLWDLKNEKEIFSTFDTNVEDLVWSVAYFPDGRRAVCGSGGVLQDNGAVRVGADNKVRVWEVGTGRLIGKPFAGHKDAVVSVAVSSGGKYVLSGSLDKTARLWEAETGREQMIFAGHSEGILSVALSQDGDQALTGSRDRTVRLWDTRTGKRLATFEGHTEAVTGVAFSNDGKRAISCSLDKTIRIWDLRTGKEFGRFTGHTDAVYCVAPVPESDRVLSGGADNVVRMWDINKCEEIKSLQGHSGTVRSIACSRDGKQALSGGDDAVLILWGLPRP